MMVMEEEYGADQVKRFLKYELDNYLTGRTLERKKELPLLAVEGQSYIHYNKGAVVMYALRDYIGEDRVNAALRDFLDATKFQQPPYTSSAELYTGHSSICSSGYVRGDNALRKPHHKSYRDRPARNR